MDDRRAGSGAPPRRLRIMVCPHELVTGGSQINAIDLASRLQGLGHDVEVFAPRGPLVARIAALGLPYRPAPPRRGEHDTATVRAFVKEMRRFRPDIVHTYESPPTISAAIAGAVRPYRGVVTVMSMSVPDYIPEHIPLLVGTGELAAPLEGRIGGVHLMEPPIDTDHDQPGDTASARAALGIELDAFVVSVVGRLSAEHHKARGIADAIDRLTALPLAVPVIVLVAGDGDEADVVRAAAERANAGGVVTVRMEGNVADPRGIYDAADVVFGMGGSALRAMAHGKPLIVQGREGFWQLLSPASVDRFFLQGYFGIGPSGGPAFDDLVRELAADPGLRRELGRFGRSLVVERYSLDAATRQLESIYLDEVDVDRGWAQRAGSLARSYGRYARFRLAVAAPGLRRSYRALVRRND
ncbi:MAG TPA: glycosyltransferase family 4 protein [Microbacterium sp.]|uniref:glycosyltransferase family 4 protein n=1 Tax=Microbacterium sp. TaxID=51671 RepID=UPI002CF88F07|nr:glycosyltransferase family 4 protein [Microbacterium sp.]HWI31345.1 glycosyltransferase family 4 protein [Microbacterium sp.]